jgi:diguanylate cyclase
MNKKPFGDERAHMVAADAVTRMNRKMRVKMAPEMQERLAAAILNSGAQDDLMFRNTPVRHRPSAWSISGIFARLALTWKRMRGQQDKSLTPDAALSEMHYAIKRNGSVRLTIAALIAVMLGILGLLLPLEFGVRVALDLLHPISASGQIVLIAQDERSLEQYGPWPWPRRHDAAVVDRLFSLGAKKVLYNPMLAGKTNEVDDRSFADMLARHKGKVWLNAYNDKNLIDNSERSVFPYEMFRKDGLITAGKVFPSVLDIPIGVSYSELIDGKLYISPGPLLAEQPLRTGQFKLESAIRYKTIPMYSMVDIMNNNIDRDKIAGKSIIIGPTHGEFARDNVLLGQYDVPNIVFRAMSAETLILGLPADLGWEITLFFAVLILFAATFQQTWKRRRLVIICGTSAIIFMMVLLNALSIHLEVIPALACILVFYFRDRSQTRQYGPIVAHNVSGLPTIVELHFVKGREKSTVIALKVEDFVGRVSGLTYSRQREIAHGIAARIGIVCPDSVVHQGEDGLFVWLLSDDDGAMLPGQLHALFMIDVADSQQQHSFDVAIGKCSDLHIKFEARLAVAIDRATKADHDQSRATN